MSLDTNNTPEIVEETEVTPEVMPNEPIQATIDEAKYVELPKVGATPEQIAKALERIGVNKEEDLADLAKDDKAFDALKPIFVKAKMTKDQINTVYKGYLDFVNKEVESIKVKNETELSKFKEEVGAEWEPGLAAARNTVKALGIDTVGLQQLEASIGSANMMKLFFNLNKVSAEPELRGVDGAGPGSSSEYIAANPADATVKINNIMKDKIMMEKIAKGDTQATKLFNDLHKVKYGK